MAASKRVKITPQLQADLLVECRRRCAVCWGLHHDFEVKPGQIAHLDQDSSNASEENLVFLCFVHHNEYDSTTRQAKGLTLEEVVRYRAALAAEVARQWDDGALKQPLLQLSVRPIGAVCPWTTTGRDPWSQQPVVLHQTPSRFCHLEVTNAHREYPVHNVQVFLTRVEKRDAAGKFRAVWTNDSARVWWRNEGEPGGSSEARTVGHAVDVDLCYLLQSPRERPNAPALCLRMAQPIPVLLLPHMEIRADDPVILYVRACGVESDSGVVRVKVSWDGQWSDDDDEIARHLAIDTLP